VGEGQPDGAAAVNAVFCPRAESYSSRRHCPRAQGYLFLSTAGHGGAVGAAVHRLDLHGSGAEEPQAAQGP
jgi:hypothetical protein